MQNYSQVPGKGNITLMKGDDWSSQFNFSIGGVAMDLSTYTNITAKLISSAGVETAITVDTSLASSGKLTLSLTAAQTTTLGGVLYSWYLSWKTGGMTRVVVAGTADILTIKQFTQVE